MLILIRVFYLQQSTTGTINKALVRSIRKAMKDPSILRILKQKMKHNRPIEDSDFNEYREVGIGEYFSSNYYKIKKRLDR